MWSDPVEGREASQLFTRRRRGGGVHKGDVYDREASFAH